MFLLDFLFTLAIHYNKYRNQHDFSSKSNNWNGFGFCCHCCWFCLLCAVYAYALGLFTDFSLTYPRVQQMSWFQNFLKTYYSLNVSPRLLCWNLTPSVKGLEGRALRKWSSYKGVFIKESPETSFAPFAMWSHSQKMAVRKEVLTTV